MPSHLSAADVQLIAEWSGHEPAQVYADPRLHEMGRLLVADALTGLYNRRYFLARLDAEVATGRRLAVAILDLDGFKQVNDSLGHDRGDEVLRACAGALEQGLPGAVVARLGGDEYAVLWSDTPVDAAAAVLEPLIRSAPLTVGETGLARPLQFSAGLAAFPEDGADASGLLRAADAAMYWAKRDRQRRVRLARDLGQVANVGDPRATVLTAPLTGREAEWERLSGLLPAVAAGAGRMISLEGPAGVGKSRLLEELAAAAARTGWRTVRVEPGAGSGSYRPLDAVLAELTGTGPPPQGGRGTGTLHRLAAIQAHRLLRILSDAGPTLVVLDDLHEADQLTWTALRTLGPGLGRRPILVAASVRTAPDPAPAWESFRTEGAAAGWLLPETLTGLDLNGTRALVLGLLGGTISNPAARSLHQATGGNPLHVTQVLKAWLSDGVLTPGRKGWVRHPDRIAPAPSDLRQALFWRVGQLETEVREILGVGAVLGNPFRLPDLQALSGASADELQDWLGRALQAQMVLSEGPGAFRFVHPLVRDAAYSGLGLQARRLAHRVAGHLLEESGAAPAAELARHFDAAGATGRAFDYHVRAGEQAVARLAHTAASQHFSRARQLLPAAGAPFEQWWTRLALQAAAAAQADGDPRGAAAVCADALRHQAGLAPDQVLALTLQWGESARLAGNAAEAEDAHRAAQALAGPETPPRERLHVRALGLRLRYNRSPSPVDLEEALAVAAEAQRLGEPALEGSLYSTAAAVLVQLGRHEEAAEWNRRALPLLPPDAGTDAVTARLRAVLLAESVAEARRWGQDALAAASAMGDVLWRTRLLRVLGSVERASGRWSTARQYLEESLQLARRQGSEVERDRTMYELGLLLTWAGRKAEGVSLARAAAAAAAARRDWLTASAALGRLAFCLLAAGEPQAALAELEPVNEWLPAHHLLRQQIRLVRAQAWLGCGDPAAAAAEAEPVRDIELPLEGPALRGWVLGAVALAGGDAAGALLWLEQARAHPGRPFVEQYWLAWVDFETGLAWRQLGQAGMAGRFVRRARRTFRRLGAPGASDQLEHRWSAPV